MATQREASKQNWTSKNNTVEEINSGCLQRIADATEVIAQNYIQITQQRDYYEKQYDSEYTRRRSAEKQFDYKCRLVTRLRNEIKKLKATK